MALSFSVLGSGSSGNSTLVSLEGRRGDRNLLLDAGLSPRETARRLELVGADPHSITDLVLTHLDADHYHRGWTPLVEADGLTVHVHERHRHAARRAELPLRRLHVFREGFELSRETTASGVLLAHDRLGSVGYVLEHRGVRLGLATDIGRASRSMLGHFTGLHGLALESNYDRRLQVNSDRPEFLKSRIMGGLGHLSNEQALDAALEIDARSELRHLVLLHLSRACNDPAIIRCHYARRAPHLLDILTIAGAEEPTPLLQVSAHGRPLRSRQCPTGSSRQLGLFG
jgi:phosphoribosyl 1,2-cyclic phosphodiesterase